MLLKESHLLIHTGQMKMLEESESLFQSDASLDGISLCILVRLGFTLSLRLCLAVDSEPVLSQPAAKRAALSLARPPDSACITSGRDHRR